MNSNKKLNTIRYLFNSTKNFSFYQVLHLIKQKFWYNLTFFLQPKSVFLPEDEFHSYNNVRTRLCKIFSHDKTDCIIPFQLNGYPKSYMINLDICLSKFALNDDTDIIQKWDDLENHFEIRNNYHRFHLFFDLITDNRKTFELILLWIEKHPIKNSIAWNSFNATIRLLNWFKIIAASTLSELTIDEWRIIENSIKLHIKFIARNIEHHIPGNHVIFQFFILWATLKAFPKWNESSSFVEAESKLLHQFKIQFPNHGFHFEQSTHYHIQVTLLLLIYFLAKKEFGEDIDREMKLILEKALKIVELMKSNNHEIPLIGDNCYNFFSKSIYHDLQLIGELRSKLNLPISNIQFDSLYEIRNQYVISIKRGSKLIFDVGNIGLPNNSGHGHADMLSIHFVYNGKPIFIDPGTRRYSNDDADLLLKRTNMHNTISINGKDQARLWGFFRWAYLPTEIKYDFKESQNFNELCGTYVAFREEGIFKHKRIIEHIDNGFRCKDFVFSPQPNYSLSINFILDPRVIIINNKESLLLTSEEAVWEFRIKSENSYKLHTDPIEVFFNYDTPTTSNKISVVFNSVNKNFSSLFDFRLLTEETHAK